MIECTIDTLVGGNIDIWNLYVKDGLVAWWDGIWNAGMGVHSSNTTTWKDLIGGYHATQRVAASGWQWGTDCYIGTSGNGHGFTVPTSFSTVMTTNYKNHTIELVYKPNTSDRRTIFGQYNGNTNATNIEYSPHLSGDFRVYYGGNPDINVSAWKTLGSKRLHCATICNGTNSKVYINGTLKTTSSLPAASAMGSQSFVLGGELNRTAMSIVGQLAVVRVYSRALTESELASNRALDIQRFSLT